MKSAAVPPLPGPSCRRRAARAAGLPDALMACAVLGLGVVAWLRLPALTAAEAAAARQQQQAAQAAENLAQWLYALRTSGLDLSRHAARRSLLPVPGEPRIDCRRQACSAAELAEEAWSQWARATAAQLPGARADLHCRAAHDRGLPPAPPGIVADAVCRLRLDLPQVPDAHWIWQFRA